MNPLPEHINNAFRAICAFHTKYPELVKGVVKLTFHEKHVEAKWSSYVSTIQEMQDAARAHQHLGWKWKANPWDRNSLDWVSEKTDGVVIVLERCEPLQLKHGNNAVDFTRQVRHNEPQLQTQEEDRLYGKKT